MKIIGSDVDKYLFTPWVAYTPTINNVTLNNGSKAGWWRREGDSIRIRCRLTIGSTTTFTGTSYNIQFCSPSGYTVNTAMGIDYACGVWAYFTNGPDWKGWSGVVTFQGGDAFTLNSPQNQNRVSGANNPITTTYNANGNYFTMEALFQVVEFA